MNGVMIVPTGIGAEIGGHAGDANPAAKLIAECCDILITHPNVLNASDINEMKENVWYVEGSILDRFLEGRINLKQPLRNKILLVTNSPIRPDAINAASAARTTIGCEIEVLGLSVPLRMIGKFKNGIASGEVLGWENLCEQVKAYDFDALAIHSVIEVDEDVAQKYYKEGGVNPWGGVEAIASKLIADKLDKPVAHAPLENLNHCKEFLSIMYDEIIEPRIAPEAISVCYMHCVLKGLSKAPRIASYGGMYIDDIDFMVSPLRCWGRPHIACMKRNIPILGVRENGTVIHGRDLPQLSNVIQVETYWEAAGYIMSMRAGIDPESVRRPISETKIIGK